MAFLVLGFFENEVSAIGALGDLERWRRRGRRPGSVIEIRTVGRVLTGAGADQLPHLSAADRLMVGTRVRAGKPALALVVDARPDGAHVADVMRAWGGAPNFAGEQRAQAPRVIERSRTTSVMNRLLLSVSAVLAFALAAAGCANADASQKPASPAQLQATATALSHVHSVAFHATLTLSVSGKPIGSAAPAAALGGEPATLDISGSAAKSGNSGVLDASFTLQNSLFPVNGELRTAEGRAVYIKLPALLGSGWEVYKVAPGALPHNAGLLSKQNSKAASAAARGFGRLNPLTLLTNMTQSAGGGTRTFSADLDTANLVAAVESLAAGRHAPPARGIGVLGTAVDVAHGSISVDDHTHLPTSISLELQATIPQAMVKRAMGITGFDLKIDATFDGWNQPVHVTIPAGAKPLELSSVSLPGGAH